MYYHLYRYLEHFKILYQLLFGFSEKSVTVHAPFSSPEPPFLLVLKMSGSGDENVHALISITESTLSPVDW